MFDMQKKKSPESQEINPHVFGQLIFNKDAKNTKWGRNISLITDVGKPGYPHRRMEVDLISPLRLESTQNVVKT
jgi:hypothetical protein